MIAFVVPGDPVPQGSMVAMMSRNRGAKPIPMLKPSNEAELKAWRRKVAGAATLALEGRIIPPNTPVTVTATFRMQPPAHMPKDRIAPTVAPDADKLLRAVLDGMTINDYPRVGKLGVYPDDKQVVDARAIKLYATTVHPPGAYIEVEFITLQEELL